MDINDLFDGIMKSINQFDDEIAEQRLRKKCRTTAWSAANKRYASRRRVPKGFHCEAGHKPEEVRRMGVRIRRIFSRKRSRV